MPTRDTPFAPGTPCWVDLVSSDLERAREFYTAVFGWATQSSGEEFGGYVNCSSDGHAVAGMMAKTPDMGDIPDVWTTYMATDDIDATVQRARDAHGEVMYEPMDVADLGRMAVVRDPAGAVFGLWQAGSHTGFGKYNEPGAVIWDELHSKDFATSAEFYEQVFGWTYDKSAGDSDEFRYWQGQVNGETVIGMMDSRAFLPDDVPSHWAVYFRAADVDAAAETAKAHGATVLQGPEDTPYGRIADLLDPTGANFKLHGDTIGDGAQQQSG